ncbi:MAG: DNA cytosine methyltransferase [Alphaproteobacteria bacterium]|nr:DNA cytosine methyltransferase [Alphaproteobacteria bacterium]
MKKLPDEPSRVVSLFSGCGGLDLGFMGGFQFAGKIYDRMPFEIVWANDLSPKACETYRHNLKHEIHCGDIWTSLELLPKQADVVIGGFPCQDVSVNGFGKAENGKRTILYRAMVKVIRRTKPRIFVAENVKGLLLDRSKAFHDQMIGDFEAAGYKVSEHLYLAADYGVPQMRERVFIVGVRGRRAFEHPTGTSQEPCRRITAQDALRDLEKIPENPEISHIWSKAAISPEQGNRKLKAGSPATTIRAECHGNIQFHYKLDRRISMREAARLQSFPDEFSFQSGLRETERQIGNAVPPVMAWHIAKAVHEYLK